MILLIDFLILARYAELINGEFSILGGALETIITPAGQPVSFQLAASVLVTDPDGALHPTRIRILDRDGTAHMDVDGFLATPEAPGSTLRIPITLDIKVNPLPTGPYRCELSVPGDLRSAAFNLISFPL